MPMVRAMRLLNSIEAGITDGTELETLLGDAGRKAEFDVLLGMRGQVKRMAASSTAMTAVTASSTARESFFGSSYSVGKGLETLTGGTNATLAGLNTMAAVTASSTAMTAVAASSTAMTAVIASSTAMTAVIASSTAMTAVAASSTAMTAVIASSTAMTAVIASSTAMTAVTASSTAMTAVAASSTARESFFGSSYSVGKGLETLTGGTNATLAGLNTMAAVIASSTAMTAVIASSTAMAAVAASSTAMTAVIASSTAMAAVAASSTAMAAVWGSDTASDAVLTSSTAKLAIYNADTALSALQANPTQVQRQINTSGRTTTGTTSTQTYQYVANGTKCILLRVWTTGGNEDLSLNWGRGLSSNDVAGGVRLPNGDNLGDNNTAAIGRTTTYASSGTYPNSNNANANVVSAANGLKRRIWSLVGSTTQNVIYILV